MRTFWFELNGEFVPIRASSKKDAQSLFSNYVEQGDTVDYDPYELMFGFEVETAYNGDLLKIKREHYHSMQISLLNDNWIAETDGSLRGYEFGGNTQTVEFISIPTVYSEVSNTIKSFQESIVKKSKRKELNKVLAFNTSTGAHVHISLIHHTSKQTTICFKDIEQTIDGEIVNLKSFVGIEFMKKAGQAFKRAIKKELPGVYPEFIKHYYRSYAKKINIHRAYNTRYQEFNFTTSHDTIEFRSSNLCGVRSWEDFNKYFIVLTDTFTKVFTKELSKETPFSSEVKIEVDALDDLDVEQTVELTENIGGGN